MFDNMSGFWRMQCAEDDFKITPKNYSFYLDPKQREKELKITWVSPIRSLGRVNCELYFQNTYVAAKEKCLRWLADYNEHFNN